MFHARARPLEAASPLLRDIFAELMTSEHLFQRSAVPVPPVTGVDPDLAHAAFSKAVEFVYTGTVEWGAGGAGGEAEGEVDAEGEEARLIPAVLATAHHLQMEALQDWCLEQFARRVAGPKGGRAAAVRAALDGPAPGEANMGRCRALADACAAWAAEAMAARALPQGGGRSGGGAGTSGDTMNNTNHEEEEDAAAAAAAVLAGGAWRAALEPTIETWVQGIARTAATGQ